MGEYSEEHDVEQTGVWLWCDWRNGAHYQAFLEMAPLPPRMLGNVRPGDLITSYWRTC